MNIPKSLWLNLDINKLTISDLSYIKICCPSVYYNDIPPLNTWFNLDINKLSKEEIYIIIYDFPELYNLNKLKILIYLLNQ